MLMNFFLSLLVEERLKLIQIGVVAKVRRRLWHVFEDLVDKFVLIVYFECIVILFLCT